jgi:hypothetical protein
MPSLMEQAVVDADKLKEAAMRNAENSILEKYSKDIKGALKTILEQAPPGFPGMEDEMMMPPDMGMAPDAPPIDVNDIPLAATGGEKLCPCPDEQELIPVTINLDDLIDVADMIKDDEGPVSAEMLAGPPMDPMMMEEPPMDPMMMEGAVFDLGDLLNEISPTADAPPASPPLGARPEQDDDEPLERPENLDPSEYISGRSVGLGAYTGGRDYAKTAGDVEEIDTLSFDTAGRMLSRGLAYGVPAAAATAAGSAALGAGATAPIGGIGAIAGIPGYVVGGASGFAVGALEELGRTIIDDNYSDKSAWDRDQAAKAAEMADYKEKRYGTDDEPAPTPDGGPAPDVDTTPQPTPKPSPDGQPAPGPTQDDKGRWNPAEINPNDYFPDGPQGRYVSQLGHQPFTSAFLKERNLVQRKMWTDVLEGGGPDAWKAVGRIRDLESEFRTIPQYTQVDRQIARSKVRGSRMDQRIARRKVRQQARPERRKRRREIRSMDPSVYTGAGGGYSAFPQSPNQLQEGNDDMIDITEEQLSSIIEELVVDMSPDTVRAGWAGLPESEKDYADELELARRSSTEEKEKQEAIQAAVEELSEKNDRLTKYSTELSEVAKQLKEKLEDVSLQNAKLFYINRTLGDASLNGRQKDKIAESIQSAVSVEEAKVIYETLQSAVPDSPRERRGKNTLSEAISRPSAILPRRKSGASDREMVFRDRMKILAGINEN